MLQCENSTGNKGIHNQQFAHHVFCLQHAAKPNWAFQAVRVQMMGTVCCCMLHVKTPLDKLILLMFCWAHARRRLLTFCCLEFSTAAAVLSAHEFDVSCATEPNDIISKCWGKLVDNYLWPLQRVTPHIRTASWPMAHMKILFKQL